MDLLQQYNPEIDNFDVLMQEEPKIIKAPKVLRFPRKPKIIIPQEIPIWKDNKPAGTMLRDKLVDPIVRIELDKVRNKVLKKDKDWVVVIDGDEGVGKSVLAQQIAKYLDPSFGIDDITFTADDFIREIKDPDVKKGKAIVLDEAFNAANARAAMSEVNRSLIGVATEMRQKNLFVIIVLPSFFDLDRYFALWRCKALFHLYERDDGERRYIIFPKEQKKYLYLVGKKTYNYSKPRSPYPPLVFPHCYTVDEYQYRLKKSKAFNKRKLSERNRLWKLQRDAYIKHIQQTTGITHKEIAEIPVKYEVSPIDSSTMSEILAE